MFYNIQFHIDEEVLKRARFSSNAEKYIEAIYDMIEQSIKDQLDKIINERPYD